MDTIDDVYSTVGTVLDGVKSDMGSDAGKLLWNRSNSVSGHWYPFSGQSTFDGGYQPLYMYRQTTVLRAFDTGTSTVIATNAYWAAGLLSINIDGTTAYVNWGAEASTEALAKANLASVTATGDVTCG